MPTIRCFVTILCCFALWLTYFTRSAPISAQSIIYERSAIELSVPLSSGIVPAATTAYPPDLPRDIAWSAYRFSWDELVAAFNHARSEENRMLNSTMPSIIFPSAESWAAMSNGQRALWLINEERVARGLRPLHALETNVMRVAQAYAQYLLTSNQFDHDADGLSPWERLAANAAIGACHDFLPIAENIYFQATSGSMPLPFALEKAIYVMLYADASSQWGHRHAILWTPYTENSGVPDREGFLGIGVAHGGFTSPFNGTFYQHTDMIVMNFFDPCPTWVEEPSATPTPNSSPTPSPTSSPAPSPTPSATVIPTTSPIPTTPVQLTPSPTGTAESVESFALHLPLILPAD